MDPQPTAVSRPIQLQIADDIRMQIERGDLLPGDALPTLADICQRWSCSMNSARGAVSLLKAQGLITAGRGKAPRVRVPPARVIRSSERHQVEKDLARRPERERSTVGEAETNLGMSIHEQSFSTTYDTVAANDSLASALNLTVGDSILRRVYKSSDQQTKLLLSYSTSYIPLSLVEKNPDLLNAENEPWPGGTMHQLSTVGIEVMTVVDEVTGRMPTTVEVQAWGLTDGIPLILCRRISLDRNDRVVEISDAEYPADRAELRFVTPLKPWRKRSKSDSEGGAK
ncbi:GntR family transcriptional regulator [Streptomyces sp. NPDC087420]|uniref:GntR family transcriptional regulator n=1 Tax=Streptomyces sp. NPDC087420 TaxID=3365785 RepID=UPI00383621AA